LERLTSRKTGTNDLDAEMIALHRHILARVYFSGGTRKEEVVRLLLAAGFERPIVDKQLQAIHRAQARKMRWLRALERGTQHRYAICARKPR
jgi:hypothetical protein